MIPPETIAAYVDGELAGEALARFEAAMASDAAIEAAVARERALRARLSARFDPILAEPVPAGLSALLTPGGDTIVSFAAARERRAARWSWPQGAAIAASLAIGLILGQTALPGDEPGLSTRGGVAVASGEIAAALETQLASNQRKDANVRIGVSFRDREGSTCRSFAAGAVAGLACKSGAEWRIAALQAGKAPAAGDYAQAGSGETAILAQAQAMMAGEPLDAAAERAARDAGWKARAR